MGSLQNHEPNCLDYKLFQLKICNVNKYIQITIEIISYSTKN